LKLPYAFQENVSYLLYSGAHTFSILTCGSQTTSVAFRGSQQWKRLRTTAVKTESLKWSGMCRVGCEAYAAWVSTQAVIRGCERATADRSVLQWRFTPHHSAAESTWSTPVWWRQYWWRHCMTDGEFWHFPVLFMGCFTLTNKSTVF